MSFTFCTNRFWTVSGTQPGSSPDSENLAVSFAGDRQRYAYYDCGLLEGRKTYDYRYNTETYASIK